MVRINIFFMAHLDQFFGVGGIVSTDDDHQVDLVCKVTHGDLPVPCRLANGVDKSHVIHAIHLPDFFDQVLYFFHLLGGLAHDPEFATARGSQLF